MSSSGQYSVHEPISAVLLPAAAHRGQNLRCCCAVIIAGETMRSKFAVLALAVLLVAAIQAKASKLPDSCGNEKIKFEVKTQKGQTAPAAPEAGKAQLILIQTENHLVSVLGDATIRFGLDGTWAGATNGNSYFMLEVAPGVHHVCANWQSGVKRLARIVDLTSLKAEAGRTYYFQADVNVDQESVNLSRPDDDKGRYLVGISGLSTSKPK